MFAIHGQLDLAGVAVRRRAAALGRRAARVRLPRAPPPPLALPLRLLRALHRRRRVPPAPAHAAQPARRAAAVPRLLARAGAALAAMAALALLARVGARLDALVPAAHLRPQFRALPELRGRLLPHAAVVPLAPARGLAGGAAHAPLRAQPAAAPPATSPRARSPAGRHPARGLAREQILLQRVREQERVLLSTQPQQPHRQPGGVAAAALPPAAAAAAPRLGLRGRALRVGPRVHAGGRRGGSGGRGRRGGARAGHEGGVPGVPQAAGAAPALARARRAPRRARPRRDRVLSAPTPLLTYVYIIFYVKVHFPTFIL